MQIISEIKVNGKWVNQDQLPEDMVAKIVAETICRAGRTVGFETTLKKKTACVGIGGTSVAPDTYSCGPAGDCGTVQYSL